MGGRKCVQHVAVQAGFGSESDRMDGEPGQIDVGRRKPLILKPVGH